MAVTGRISGKLAKKDIPNGAAQSSDCRPYVPHAKRDSVVWEACSDRINCNDESRKESKSLMNVLPEETTKADIGLVCALPLELSEFIGKCSKVKTYTGGSFTFRGGFYGKIRIAMVESGPGCARARRATAALLDAHSPRWIVSTGFCGALVPDLKIGQIVVANEVVNASGDSLKIDLGMTSDDSHGLRVGRTLTVDRMVRSVKEKTNLSEMSQAIAVDMETFEIARLCQDRKTRFMAVRAVSDDLSGDLPSEVLTLVGETGSVRIGAVIGALWKRPGSYKDMWRLRENAILASEHLAKFLDGVVKQLNATQ
jgi:adenosylhomocysteine nucleosidase